MREKSERLRTQPPAVLLWVSNSSSHHDEHLGGASSTRSPGTRAWATGPPADVGDASFTQWGPTYEDASPHCRLPENPHAS